MQGQETYKFAVTSMVRDVRQVMEEAGITGEQVKAVIPHQANYRIINEARRRLPEIAPEKFLINIERYGNTSSASEPILLDEPTARACCSGATMWCSPPLAAGFPPRLA